MFNVTSMRLIVRHLPLLRVDLVAIFPPITDLQTATPLTLIDLLQVGTDCSPYVWTNTLTALLSSTAHAASPVTLSVVPYTTYNVTYVFTDLTVTALKPGDVMTIVLSFGRTAC
jgi:hypothetical protein